MTASTPLYGFPYETLNDAPDGPNLGEDLATAVETKIASLDAADVALDARLDLLEASKPYAHLLRTTTQSIANDVTTEVILWNGEVSDSASAHDTVTNSDRYTIPKDGTYESSGGVGFTSNSTGRRGCWLTKNGTIVDGSGAMVHTSSAGPTIVTARTVTIPCVAGDILRFVAYQQSGGALTTSATTFEQPSWEIRYLHA
jgi:hypothetical protein